jgi:pteridine reductase
MRNNNDMKGKVVLVTGAAKRIGAAIARQLHAAGADVVIHYRSSVTDAARLADELNSERADSALLLAADLLDTAAPQRLVDDAVDWKQRLDCLVNNASSFYPTPVGEITEDAWNDLIGSNLKAPTFLSQAAAPHLRKTQGVIINIVDIHSQRPLRDHPVYGSAKMGLAMLTRSLAKDLAPEIRVNGVSPGAILWPEDGMSDAVKQTILRQVPLQRPGNPDDIAGCVLYLVRDAGYITGQIIAVDGGRSIGW